MKKMDLEFIVTCVHCRQSLWDMKILMHDGKRSMASQWMSRHPELYPSKAPDGWECPLCHKTFARLRKQSGDKAEYDMRVIHGEAVRWI